VAWGRTEKYGSPVGHRLGRVTGEAGRDDVGALGPHSPEVQRVVVDREVGGDDDTAEGDRLEALEQHW